ncbi:MDR family MFS transporter [Paucibacter sp. APW11]|uniref:MDR family MFS transporter n=2 Tax=Roseateles aquae TaxID=3077235 RepID=A0ABU3P617_9BURK|nr:MDR family MFS transporter [Paucibacter sp. APW11]
MESSANQALHGAAPLAAPDGRSSFRASYLALMVVIALGTLDQSIVATALPRIMAEFGGIATSSWVVTAYVLASTAAMPLYGKLGDQYGRKAMICVAVITFIIGSLLCGMSTGLIELVMARVLQGLGAGGFMPLAQAIIADLIPAKQRGRKQGAIAAVYALTSVAGPIVGGGITEALSWHWIFYVNLPVGGAALFVLLTRLHSVRPIGQQKIDYLGAMMLTATVSAILLLLSMGGSSLPWDSAECLALAGTGLVLLGLLGAHLRRTAMPILPLSLFDNRLFNIASVVMGLTFMGLFGATIFLPMYSQVVVGDDPTRSGLLMVPLMLGAVIGSLLSGRILTRSERYKPTQKLGLAMACVAFALLAWAVMQAQREAVITPIVLTLGIGLGLVMPNMTVAVQNALPFELRGVGTAMLTFFRSLGGLIGVAASGAFVASQVDTLQAQGTLVAQAYRSAIAGTFAVGAAVLALAFLVLLLLPELPLQDPGHEQAGDVKRPAGEGA